MGVYWWHSRGKTPPEGVISSEPLGKPGGFLFFAAIRPPLQNCAVNTCLCLALLVAFATYSPGLNGPLLFDDLSNIVFEPDIHLTTLDSASLRKALWSRMESPPGRPLSMLSFALNHYFTRFDAFYFKLTHLVIHLFCASLLFPLTHTLLNRHKHNHPASWLRHEQAKWVALFVTAAWLLHPLNLTSVLYVVQRMTSLATLFTLFGLTAYVIGRESIIAGKRHGFIVIALSVPLSLGAAVLSKENGALLPLFVLLIEAFIYRLQAHQEFQTAFRRFFIIMFVIPLVVAFIFGIYLFPQLINADAYTTRVFSPAQRLLTEARALWLYLRLITLPVATQMSIFHDNFAVSRDWLHPISTLFAVIGLFLLLGWAITASRRFPITAFGLAWFFVGHSLESTIVPLELVHEHRNYLPQFGILLALLYGAGNLASRYNSLWKLRLIPGLLYLSLLAGMTYARANDWRSEMSLYQSEAQNNPGSARAHTTLAIAYHKQRQYDLALEHFQRAAELGKNDSTTIIRLAHHMLLATGTIPEEVMTEMAERLESNPYSHVTLWTLEPLLSQAVQQKTLHGRLLDMYEQLVARKDVVLSKWQRVGAAQTLARNFRQRKEYGKALHYLAQTIELDWQVHDAYLSSAEIHLETNNKQAAADMMRRLEKLNGGLSPEQQRRQAEILRQTGS